MVTCHNYKFDLSWQKLSHPRLNLRYHVVVLLIFLCLLCLVLLGVSCTLSNTASLICSDQTAIHQQTNRKGKW